MIHCCETNKINSTFQVFQILYISVKIVKRSMPLLLLFQQNGAKNIYIYIVEKGNSGELQHAYLIS